MTQKPAMAGRFDLRVLQAEYLGLSVESNEMTLRLRIDKPGGSSSELIALLTLDALAGLGDAIESHAAQMAQQDAEPRQ